MRRARNRTGWVVLAGLAVLATIALVTPTRAQPERLEPRVRAMQRSDGEPYRLYRFRIPLARARVRVVDVGMRRHALTRLVREGAALAINGGFYAPDTRPEGLVVEGDRELNPFLARIGGGVLTLSAHHAALHDAEAPLALPRPLDFAMQCRPRLVVDGANNIARPTPQTAARTALCVRDAGRGLDVYVARRDPSRGRAGPNLYDLAEALVAEGCEQALNLDGGPSTGVAWRSARGVRALPERRGIRHAIAFDL